MIQVEGMKKCKERPKIILVEIIKEVIKSMTLDMVELCTLNV